MADPLTDPVILGVLGLAVGLAVLAFLEVKYVRKSARAERERAARRIKDLPDDAHNAILTAKAVSSALRRTGVVTDEADSLIREAETAMARQNFRVVVELTDRAKGVLKAEKSRHDTMGDLVRLEKPATTEAGAVTTKEQLARDLPPNYTASKFAIGRSEDAVAAGRAAGRDVGPAERLVEKAKAGFGAEDYGAALALALQARKAAEGLSVPEAVLGAANAAPAGCPKCGTPVEADDAFCRKCGTKLASRLSAEA